MSDIDRSQPGIYTDCGRREYVAIPAANYSTLKHFERTPAHAREAIAHPKSPTDAMELGTALHMAILEPERFGEEYVLAPQVDRRYKEGKAEWKAFEAAHPGRNYLTPDEWEQCEGMQRAIAEHATARELLYGEGRNEVCAVWRDAETGLPCKGLLDRFTRCAGWSMVIDLKSADDANEIAFSRQVVRMGYHVQAAFYVDGLAQLAKVARRFLTIAVEKKPPYCPIVYELDDRALEVGRAKYRRYLATYAECRRENRWPGYADGIHPLSIPRWAEGELDQDAA